MAKQLTAMVKLQCPGGQATPAPPVGPALGAHGVNIGQFVKQFNDRTQHRKGMMLPLVISVYSDRTFDFIIKSPPAAVLLKQAAGLPIEKKKAGELIPGEEKTKKSGKYKGFKVTLAQVKEIAKVKQADLNARDVDHAARIVAGTARSMGITVRGRATQRHADHSTTKLLRTNLDSECPAVWGIGVAWCFCIVGTIPTKRRRESETWRKRLLPNRTKRPMHRRLK